MKSRKCEENLYFWIDVELFKMETAGDIKEQANIIYAKFLSNDAEYQVNLDSDAMRTLNKRFMTGDVDRAIFDVAQRSVFKLMEFACIAGFQRFQGKLNTKTSKCLSI
jgi:hypothetical protein